MKDYLIVERYADYQYAYVGCPQKGLPILAGFLLGGLLMDAEVYAREFEDPEEVGSYGDETDVRQESPGIITLTPGEFSMLTAFTDGVYPYVFTLPVSNFIQMIRDWRDIRRRNPKTIRFAYRGDDVVFEIISSSRYERTIGLDILPTFCIVADRHGRTVLDEDNLRLLIECLMGDMPLCAQWYKEFAMDPDQELVQGSNHVEITKKDGILNFRPLGILPPHTSFSLPINDFVRLVDEWCVAYARQKDGIVVSIVEGKIRITVQQA